VLPVLGLLVVGAGLLGVGTLKDLALVQLTGLMIGTFSSIFIATPLLVTLREYKGEVAVHTKRVLARRTAQASRETQAASGEPVAAVSAAKVSAAATSPVRPARAGKPAQKRPAGAKAGARPSGKRTR